MNHPTIDLGNDDNHKLIISPNKTINNPSTQINQKPPKFPASPKVHLVFNSPVGSPIKINSLENLNLYPAAPLGHSSPNLGLPTSSPRISGPNLSLLKLQSSPNPVTSPIAHKTTSKSPPLPKAQNGKSPQSQTSKQKSSFLYNNPQIPLSNSFIPLSKTSKNSSSLHPSSSNSTSTPSIPPGFEDFIPSPLKTQREQKRLRKIQKKKMRRQASISSQKTPPSHPLAKQNHLIATEIIELGLQLGMDFSGPLSELHNQIIAILARQQEAWLSSK